MKLALNILLVNRPALLIREVQMAVLTRLGALMPLTRFKLVGFSVSLLKSLVAATLILGFPKEDSIFFRRGSLSLE